MSVLRPFRACIVTVLGHSVTITFLPISRSQNSLRCITAPLTKSNVATLINFDVNTQFDWKTRTKKLLTSKQPTYVLFGNGLRFLKIMHDIYLVLRQFTCFNHLLRTLPDELPVLCPTDFTMLLLYLLMTCLVPVQGEFSSTPLYGHWLHNSGYRLAPDRLESGAYAVEVASENGRFGPLCEDGLNDRTAVQLCEMRRYGRGLRTTYRTNEKFVQTRLSCFKKVRTAPRLQVDSLYYGTFNFVKSKDECSSVKYSDAAALPCAKNQAAAVFCHNKDDLPRYEVYDVEVKSTGSIHTYRVTFRIQFVKMGRKFGVVGKQGLEDHPLSNDFQAVACGNDRNVEFSVSRSKFELKGEFDSECDQPEIDLLHMGRVFKTLGMKRLNSKKFG